MNSAEIGETIEQLAAENLNDAWKQWSLVATDWILEQIKHVNLTKSDVLGEILNTEPQLLPDLELVWLADFCIDFSIEVIQVIVVGYRDHS